MSVWPMTTRRQFGGGAAATLLAASIAGVGEAASTDDREDGQA